jgi:hypothetical protein
VSAVPFHDNKRTGAIPVHDPHWTIPAQHSHHRRRLDRYIHTEECTGSSIPCALQWSQAADLERPIPRHTEAVAVVLDRVGHALARKIRIEAGRRGLPIVSESAPI